MSERRPHFGFVCDHGIDGGRLDEVCLLPWRPDRPGWWPVEGVNEDALLMWPMEGDQHGHDPARLVPEWSAAPDRDRRVADWYTARGLTPDDLRRWAIEIRCPQKRCSQRAYRSDDTNLQTLLNLIATDEKFRAAVTVSADDKLIVMRLRALHSARRHAVQHYGLRV